MADLLLSDDAGLACPRGGFYVDPWRPVPLAVLTHAHADHARVGSARYIATRESVPILRRRLGPDAVIDAVEYGQRIPLGDTIVSLHSAGHVLGSAQIRVESGGETWLMTGDLKRDPDPTCAPFEIVRADVIITEATFALPIYRWPDPVQVVDQLRERWKKDGLTVVFAYALGKSQRILSMLGPDLPGPIYAHGAVRVVVDAYREAGVILPEVRPIEDKAAKKTMAGALVLAPPSARGTPWMKRFSTATTAFASGWMQVRGDRRRRAIDLGMVLSDHADWPGLLRTIEDSGATRVLLTHGHGEPLARWLREQGKDATVMKTLFEGEAE